jgi:hypothetical protein
MKFLLDNNNHLSSLIQKFHIYLRNKTAVIKNTRHDKYQEPSCIDLFLQQIF